MAGSEALADAHAARGFVGPGVVAKLRLLLMMFTGVSGKCGSKAPADARDARCSGL